MAVADVASDASDVAHEAGWRLPTVNSRAGNAGSLSGGSQNKFVRNHYHQNICCVIASIRHPPSVTLADADEAVSGIGPLWSGHCTHLSPLPGGTGGKEAGAGDKQKARRTA